MYLNRKAYVASRASAPASQRPNRATLLTIETCICLGWIALSWFLSTEFVSPWWSVISLIVFLWAALIAFRVMPKAGVLLASVIIGQGSNVAALATIAFGAKIPELATMGEPGGFTNAYVLYCVILWASFIVTFGAVYKLSGRGGPGARYPLTPLFDRFAGLIALAIVAFAGLQILDLMVSGARSGFPLLTHTDRFLFRRVYADKATIMILNLKPITSLMLGMVAFAFPCRSLEKLGAKLAFVGLMGMYALFGDKFFTMIGSISSFLLPYLYINSDRVLARIGRYTLVGATCLVLGFGLTWAVYSEGGRVSSDAVMERLSGRIAGQGELWFLQYQVGAPVWNWDSQLVRGNVAALTIKEADVFALRESLGPFYFSNRYSPNKIRASMQRQGGTVTLTAAMEPLALAAFGFGGLVIVMIIMGAIGALVFSYVAFAIRSRSLLALFGSSFVAIQYRFVFSQGTPWNLIGIYALKWIGLVLVLEVVLYTIGVSQQRRGGAWLKPRPLPGSFRPTRRTRRAGDVYAD